jgi:hypothetical protein
VDYPQKQSSLPAPAIGGNRGSGMLFLIGSDIQVPHVDAASSDEGLKCK